MLVGSSPVAAALSSVIAQPMSSWQRTYVIQVDPAGATGIARSVRVIRSTRRVASVLHSSTISELWYARSHSRPACRPSPR